MTKIRTLLKSSANADGRHPVLLVLSDRGKREYFKTGFSVLPKEFDSTKDMGRFVQGRGIPAFKVERQEDDGSKRTYTNKEANDVLARLESRAQSILQRYNEDHINWGFEQFRSDFTNAPKRESFYTFAMTTIDQEYRAHGQYKTAIGASEAMQSLLLYDGQLKGKTFQDITVKYLRGYIDFCRKKGNTDATIKIRLEVIRRIFNIAIRDKVISPELYPFSSGKEDGKIKIPKPAPSKTDLYLSTDSMKVLENATFENYVLERTRHLYLFSYRCRGINWKDMALLTKQCFYYKPVYNEKTQKTEQKLMMEYRRSKTKGEFEIEVRSDIQKELDWFKANTDLYGNYVLPIIRIDVAPDKLDSYIGQVRKRFNTSLRTIVQDLNLPKSEQNITFYTARHSFAMNLRESGKVVDIISEALGHQSVETTKHYLAKFGTTRLADETEIDLSLPAKKKRTVVAAKKGTRKKQSKPVKKKAK